MPRITLIGYRGCGKSTIAALLARRLGIPWHDADAVLEERVGLSIVSIVRDRGEPAFRDLEAELLAGLLGGLVCNLCCRYGRSAPRAAPRRRGGGVVP